MHAAFNRWTFALICTAGALLTGVSPAQDYQNGHDKQTEPGYRIETVADGLNHPWSIAWLPDGRALVTERPGRLRMIVGDRLLDAPIDGVPEVFAASQGGLFEALPGPDFTTSGWIYLSFAYGAPEANATRVVRARLDDTRLVDHEVLFTAQPMKNTPVHYGGRMTFLPDGTLLVGLGDGFDFREQAQQLDSHLGKIVRIHADGSVPADNPFVDTDGALPEIYSYGHRNIQGLVYDAQTDTIWQHEHGPRGGDEVNVIEPGANYGWPVTTYGIDYSGAMVSPFETRPGMIDPLLVWTPSIAPSAMTLYNGDLFPAWRGDLILTALAARHARRIDLDDGRFVDQQILFAELGERLRDIRTGPDGALYVLTDSEGGKVLRLIPAN